jgi:hypothetical protein
LNAKEEKAMKQNGNSKLSKVFCRAAIAVVAMGIAAAPAVQAKPNSKKAAGIPANVVAHVEISGGPVTRMLLVKKDSKVFLLLGLDSTSGVALLDVSEPERPRAIATTAGAAGAPATELKIVTDTLELFGTYERDTASPSDPKEIRRLSGVTAFIKDKAHGLIYAANSDGLWIVKTKQRADADATTDYY